MQVRAACVGLGVWARSQTRRAAGNVALPTTVQASKFAVVAALLSFGEEPACSLLHGLTRQHFVSAATASTQARK